MLVDVATETHRYTGVTEDLQARLAKHNAGKVPHTSKFKPWRIQTAIAFDSKEKATAFEKYLNTGSGNTYHCGWKIFIQCEPADPQCFRAGLIDDFHQFRFDSGIFQITQNADRTDDLTGFGTLFAGQLFPNHIPDEFRTVIVTGLCL